MSYRVEPVPTGEVIPRIEAEVAVGGTEWRTIVTDLTPELAQTLLDRYGPMRRPWYDQETAMYAYRIKHPDPEDYHIKGITIGADGKTVAGKHLLRAVIHTGVTITAWIDLNWTQQDL